MCDLIKFPDDQISLEQVAVDEMGRENSIEIDRTSNFKSGIPDNNETAEGYSKK